MSEFSSLLVKAKITCTSIYAFCNSYILSINIRVQCTFGSSSKSFGSLQLNSKLYASDMYQACFEICQFVILTGNSQSLIIKCKLHKRYKTPTYVIIIYCAMQVFGCKSIYAQIYTVAAAYISSVIFAVRIELFVFLTFFTSV